MGRRVRKGRPLAAEWAGAPARCGRGGRLALPPLDHRVGYSANWSVAGTGAGRPVVRLWIRRRAASAPAAANPAPASRAVWKPSVRATEAGVAGLPARASLVVEMAIDERTATPSAPPTCWVVLIRPEARPESSVLDAFECADRHRDEREAEPETGHDQSRHQIGQIAHRQPRCGRGARFRRRAWPVPATIGSLGPIRVTAGSRPTDADQRRNRQREPGQAGTKRRVTEHLLQVERDDEEHPEHRRRRTAARPRSSRTAPRTGRSRTARAATLERLSISDEDSRAARRSRRTGRLSAPMHQPALFALTSAYTSRLIAVVTVAAPARSNPVACPERSTLREQDRG